MRVLLNKITVKNMNNSHNNEKNLASKQSTTALTSVLKAGHNSGIWATETSVSNVVCDTDKEERAVSFSIIDTSAVSVSLSHPRRLRKSRERERERERESVCVQRKEWGEKKKKREKKKEQKRKKKRQK